MGRVNDGDECDGQDRDVTGGPDEARRILAATLARIQVAMIMRGDRPAGEVLAEIGTALDGLGDALEDGTAGVPDGSGPPEVRRSPCEADQGEDHVQVRTGGNWLCVRALRGLDAGWVELAAQLEEARAERDRHAAASGILDRAIGRQERHLHAARIDVARGSLDAAAEVLNEALDGYEGEPAWDGKESGAQWLERARPKAPGNPASLDELAKMPGVVAVKIGSFPHGYAYAEVKVAGELAAVIGRTATGLAQYETVAEWEKAGGVQLAADGGIAADDGTEGGADRG